MTSEVYAAILVGVVLPLLTQTGAFLWWGGKVSQMLKDHDRRLDKLEG